LDFQLLTYEDNRLRRMSNPNAVIRLIDDDVPLLSGLEFLLQAKGYSTKFYSSARNFLAHDDPSIPGCIVLDIEMPGITGIELQNILLERGYHHPIIFLSGHGDIDIAVRAVKKGAVDFLQKPIDADRLLDIIEEALEKDMHSVGAGMSNGELRQLLNKLTSREKQIVKLILEGLENKDIALRLNLSPRTVENHRASAYHKIGVNSSAQLREKLKPLAGVI
jgi:two-component system response regulator DctR